MNQMIAYKNYVQDQAQKGTDSIPNTFVLST